MPVDLKELEENIDNFLEFFREQIENVREADFKKSNNIFKKVLYVGFMDTLSKTTAHPKKSNRERVVSFVRTFCNWPSCEKISLPHLVRLLEKVPDPEFSDLREYAFSLFDKWEEGKFITLDSDPNLKEIRNLWPIDISKPLEDIRVEFLQHVNLFYKYRNSLVHELREPGHGMEFKVDTEPYYHTRSYSDSKNYTWELVYPLGFYDNLCENAIGSLRDYYLKERIDPYSYYTFGTYWIEELNK